MSSVWFTSSSEHAQRGDLGAVDVEEELRRLGAELGGHVGQTPGSLFKLVDRGSSVCSARRPGRQSAAVLDDELEAAATPRPGSAMRRRRSHSASGTCFAHALRRLP